MKNEKEQNQGFAVKYLYYWKPEIRVDSLKMCNTFF